DARGNSGSGGLGQLKALRFYESSPRSETPADQSLRFWKSERIQLTCTFERSPCGTDHPLPPDDRTEQAKGSGPTCRSHSTIRPRPAVRVYRGNRRFVRG